jgi:hypothetical protein
MSLHEAAQHLAAHGRGDDKVLVHMTPGEVKSLNDLAMAHGGSLTINPHTGLPEAGFLSGMLPMILGAGLAAATGGSSLLIGAGIGGLQAARTGSIGKGLMAGLGAWGGAGLGAGLSAAGEGAIQANALNAGQSTAQALEAGTNAGTLSKLGAGVQSLGSEAGRNAVLGQLGGGMAAAQTIGAAATPALIGDQKAPTAPTPDKDMGQRYSFTGNQPQATPAPDVPTYEDMLTKQGNFGRQQNYFATPTYTPINPSQAKDLYHFAGGGPVENMSNNAAIGANTMYPMANMATSAFATPYQDPKSTNMMAAIAPSGGGTVDAMSGEPNMQGTRLADGGIASFGFGGFLGDAVSSIGSAIGHIGKSDSGGSSEGWKKLLENMGGKQSVAEPAGYQYNAETQQYEPKPMAEGGLSDAHYNLGGYSDGGRLLRGPGDGVSDSIPATIGHKQPARLADGEFVVPARIVSELGNGSTEAGARKLYAMMDRVQAARKKTVGKDKVAHNSRADKYLPA